MRRIERTPYHSWRIGKLPEGCRLCVKGRKTVLLATGLCASGCWYCPLSAMKRGRDVVVANEWWVKGDEDILKEVKLCSSRGAGITGGDPLCRIDRTVKYIRMLKKRFGRKFHIHLYTTGKDATPENLRRLYQAGLDEIRFHPHFLSPKFERSEGLEAALKFGWNVGCEIPAIPGKIRETKGFIDYISSVGVKFLNLNELEISETNAGGMEERGFRPAGESSFAVSGSREAAMKLLSYCAKNTNLSVHYCTVKLKDAVQLRNRIKLRAGNVAKEYDIITDEGLLVRGAIYLPELSPSFDYAGKIRRIGKSARKRILAALERKKAELYGRFGVPKSLMEIDERKLRILSGAWIAEELAKEIKSIGLAPAVVEEYPTWDGLCVDLRML